MYKVLVVDDERYICESLINALNWESLGFEKPLSAFNGRDAADIIKHYNPDLIVTDVKMPIMDGIELAKYINRCFPKINIIFISAYDDFQYARQVIEFGVKSYLLKPVEKDVLKETVLCVMGFGSKSTEFNFEDVNINRGRSSTNEHYSGNIFTKFLAFTDKK